MGPVLVALKQLDERLQTGPRHPLVGPGSIHASLIEGGQEFSSFPASACSAANGGRSPARPTSRSNEELREIAGDADLRIVASRDPLAVAARPPVRRARRRGSPADEHVGAPFWTDAALIAGAGIPTVLFGPAARERMPRSSGSTSPRSTASGRRPARRRRVVRLTPPFGEHRSRRHFL